LAWQANLAAMRMPTEQQIEFGMGRLLVYLGSMGQEKRKFMVWNIGPCSLKIVGAVKVGIINP
jgi:hypothetical protein